VQLERLQEAIPLRLGPAIVTGPAGSGKTVLCQALANQADGSTFTALIIDRIESEEDLLTRILRNFGVVSRAQSTDDPPARVTTQQLIDTLVRFLRGLRPIKATAVLIVDDAQNLPPAVLTQIARLAELEVDREPLIQIVLAGTPALLEMLRAPEGSSLDQGVAVRCELHPLPELVEAAPWLQRRRASPSAALGVALLMSALAVGVTAIVYERLGF
jgi:general secretion pathway protein A